MPRYVVRHHYRSLYYGFEAGQVIEVDVETAAYLERDSPGVLQRLEDAPAVFGDTSNRQVTTASTRRRRGVTGEG